MYGTNDERRGEAFRRGLRRGVVAAVAVVMGMFHFTGGLGMMLDAGMPTAMANAKIDLYEARYEPTEAVRKASPAELQAAVQDFLGFWDRNSYVDPEILWSAGIGVGKAGATGIDTAIGAWLGETPTPKRRVIAAAFLEGYWPWAAGVDAAVVAGLRGSLAVVERDDDAYGASLRALAGVLGERSGLDMVTRARVRQDLLRRRGELIAEQRLEGTVAVLDKLVPR